MENIVVVVLAFYKFLVENFNASVIIMVQFAHIAVIKELPLQLKVISVIQLIVMFMEYIWIEFIGFEARFIELCKSNSWAFTIKE